MTASTKYKLKDFLFVTLLLISLLSLSSYFIVLKKKQVHSEAEIAAFTYGGQLALKIHAELNQLIGLSNGINKYIQIEEGKIDSTKLLDILKDTKNQSHLIRNIGIAEGFKMKYLWPIQGNERAINLDYRSLPGQWPSVEKIVVRKESALTGPIKLIQGGTALIYRKPIFINTKYWGLSSTVIDIHSMFTEIDSLLSPPYHSIAIRSLEDTSAANIVVGLEDNFYNEDFVVMNIDVPNNKWQLAVGKQPSEKELRYLRNLQAFLYLVTLILAALFMYLVKLRRNNRLKEEHYKLVSENSLDLVWVFDLSKNNYTFISRKTKELFGYTVHEVKNGAVPLLPHPTLYNQNVEQQIKHKDGHYIWLETNTKHLKKGKNKDKVIGITRNIEDKKQYEIRLSISEKRLQRIVDSTFAGIVLINENGRFVYSNPNSIHILGYSEDELREMYIYDLLEKDAKYLLKKQLTKLLSKAEGQLDKEIQFENASGEQVWAQLNAIHLNNQEENMERILMVFQDISNQKENEKKLQKHIHSKNRLFSILAHDLKSPFNHIIGTQNILLDKTKELNNPSLENLCNLSLKASYETYTLLENLLYWSRLEEHELTPHKEKINARKFVEEVVDLYRNQLKLKNIELNNFTDPDIILDIDLEMIKTVLRNLISNAIKYCPPHGNIKIYGTELNQDFIEISVQDNGIGMDSRTANSLFNMEKTIIKRGTEGEKGTGFGLVVSKEFVELHGGEVTVESQFGLGSIFKVKLPKSNSDFDRDLA